LDQFVYVPLIPFAGRTRVACPDVSANFYAAGPAFQYELDDPVRPAAAHADKNLALRGYAPNPDPAVKPGLVDYGSGDPTAPPQLATLFDPPRVPAFEGVYRVNNWVWAPSPAPGTRGEPIADWPVTALGLEAAPGEVLRVPESDYDIGSGMEVILLYADADTVALKYAREDSAGAPGYTVHVDGICTDPNLLALYGQADDPAGPRYVYVPPAQRPYSYDLPVLAAGQPMGIAAGRQVVVALVDSGAFLDPRSCREWWQVRPGYDGCG
jgi:hypothetical protein